MYFLGQELGAVLLPPGMCRILFWGPGGCQNLGVGIRSLSPCNPAMRAHFGTALGGGVFLSVKTVDEACSYFLAECSFIHSNDTSLQVTCRPVSQLESGADDELCFCKSHPGSLIGFLKCKSRM